MCTIDFSLFAGDLLGTWSPVVKPAAGEGVLDGWKDISEAGSPLALTPSEPPSPVSDYQDGSPFSSPWLDTPVDLLDYLAGPELEGLPHCAPEPETLVSVPEITDPSVRAVQVLRSIAEDNDSLLRDGTSNLPMVVCEPDPADVSDILDLIPNSLDDLVNPSSILAPMSSEDIDLILSSEPPSPAGSSDSSTDVLPAYLTSPDFVKSENDSQDALPAYLVSSPDITSEDDSRDELPAPAFVLSSDFTESEDESKPVVAIDLSSDVLHLLSQVQANTANAVDVISIKPGSPLSIEDMVRIHRPKPYERPRKPGSSKGLPREVIQMERKLRKKQQNKDAATRYRQKKKAESLASQVEEEAVVTRNKELHEKVDSMRKEISYLKDLLAEVYEARGMSVPKFK